VKKSNAAARTTETKLKIENVNFQCLMMAPTFFRSNETAKAGKYKAFPFCALHVWSCPRAFQPPTNKVPGFNPLNPLFKAHIMPRSPAIFLSY
jgi:hypothetical protein